MNGRIGAAQGLFKNQRGTTGLETAIILIAFVMVASVFAFAVITAGLFSSDQARETATESLGQEDSSADKAENRASLGIWISDNTDIEGAQVTRFREESPAWEAGVWKGDIIIAFDEQEISSWETLLETLGRYDPGDQVTLTIHRDGDLTDPPSPPSVITIDVTLREE